MANYLLPILILTTLSGCDLISDQSEICYPLKDNIEQFSIELRKKQITFEKSNKEGCIIAYDLDDKVHKEIRERLFGTSHPEGLNISLPIESYGEVDGIKFKIDQSKRILERLENENIDTKFITYFGQKYLVWQESDDVLVRKIIDNR